jgi:hypothetical protein
MTQILGFVLLLAFGNSANASVLQDDIPVCASDLAPASTVFPKLPAHLHNEFTGKVVASFIVDAAGRVESASILSSDWHPVGRTRENPDGYNKLILSAVKQWQYPQQLRPCRHQVPFEFIWDDISSSAAGRRINTPSATHL